MHDVRRYAIEQNERFPLSLGRDDAQQVAYSVATWTWSKRKLDPKAQQRRGRRSGQVRRAAVADRDIGIVESHADGISAVTIAEQLGISARQVRRIVKRTPRAAGILGL